jgi:hypothetical protein
VKLRSPEGAGIRGGIADVSSGLAVSESRLLCLATRNFLVAAWTQILEPMALGLAGTSLSGRHSVGKTAA